LKTNKMLRQLLARGNSEDNEGNEDKKHTDSTQPPNIPCGRRKRQSGTTRDQL
jgi:hypothetical protein